MLIVAVTKKSWLLNYNEKIEGDKSKNKRK